MKKLYFIILLLLSASAFAANTDTVAYNLQRKKIHDLLNTRSQKFNQYMQSLDQHTGIFGWQTKKDIRRSGEILMEIVHNDNTILQELKILLDYKTFQTTQVVAQSTDTQDKALNYMVTINKLRKQNELLLKQHQEKLKENENLQTIQTIIIILLIITSIFLLTRIKKVNRV